MAEVLQETVARDQQQGAGRSQASARPCSRSVSLPEDQAEIERVLAGQADLVLFDVVRGAARHRARRLQEPEARAARRRRRPRSRSTRRVGELVDRSVTFTPDGGARRRDGRSRHGRLRRQDRRRSRSRAARAEDGADRARPGQLHPRLRGRHRRRQGRRGARRRSPRSRTTIRSPRWPARTPSFDVKVKEVAAAVRPAIDDDVRQDAGCRKPRHS